MSNVAHETTAVEVTAPRKRRVSIYYSQTTSEGVRKRLVAWADAPEHIWDWLRTEFSFAPGAFGDLGTEVIEPKAGGLAQREAESAYEEQIFRQSGHLLQLHSSVRQESQDLSSFYRGQMVKEIERSEQRIEDQRRRESEELALSYERIDKQRRREEEMIVSSEQRINEAYDRMRKTLEAVDGVLPLLNGSIASASRPATAQAMAESLVELLKDPHSPVGQLMIAKARTLIGTGEMNNAGR